jgi:hypothetical protein
MDGLFSDSSVSFSLTSRFVLQSAWPDKHLGSIGWKNDKNMCVSCPLTGNNCPSFHRMSPVDLVRDRAIEDNPNWKECPDWHW